MPNKVCLDCYKAKAANWSLYDKVELAEALGELVHEYQLLLWELNRKQDEIDAARSKA